jgi:hypothetical protein
MIAIPKSSGTNSSEQKLAEYCERSFLKLWSYPNPFKDDGKELCDLLAVFEERIFLFFDRRIDLKPSTENIDVAWKRWKKKTIDKQLNTMRGAERYILSGRNIYLDAKRKVRFPIAIYRTNPKIHKIIIAL